MSRSACPAGRGTLVGVSRLLELRLHAAVADRLHQRGVVALVLVGVGDGELGDRVRRAAAPSPMYPARMAGSPERAWARARPIPQLRA